MRVGVETAVGTYVGFGVDMRVDVRVGVAIGVVHAMAISAPKPKTISHRSTVRMVES